jgi:hypothetical protein
MRQGRPSVLERNRALTPAPSKSGVSRTGCWNQIQLPEMLDAAKAIFMRREDHD